MPYCAAAPHGSRPRSSSTPGAVRIFAARARRAAAMGAVFHEVIVPDPAEFDALFDEAAAIELRSWKREAGSAMLCDPAKEAFFAPISAMPVPRAHCASHFCDRRHRRGDAIGDRDTRSILALQDRL
jgi:hypothetical protein